MSEATIDLLATFLARFIVLIGASLWLWIVDAFGLTYTDSLAAVTAAYSVLAASQIKRDKKYRDD